MSKPSISIADLHFNHQLWANEANFFAQQTPIFENQLSDLIAVFANTVCPVLMAAGLFTRLAVFPILMITLTGIFIVHNGDPARVRDIPYMYSAAFSLILLLGPGGLSLDGLLARRFFT